MTPSAFHNRNSAAPAGAFHQTTHIQHSCKYITLHFKSHHDINTSNKNVTNRRQRTNSLNRRQLFWHTARRRRQRQHGSGGVDTVDSNGGGSDDPAGEFDDDPVGADDNALSTCLEIDVVGGKVGAADLPPHLQQRRSPDKYLWHCHRQQQDHQQKRQQGLFSTTREPCRSGAVTPSGSVSCGQGNAIDGGGVGRNLGRGDDRQDYRRGRGTGKMEVISPTTSCQNKCTSYTSAR